MARGYGTYSRVVAWLKILLPLLALAVLATVFLVTSDDNFEAGFSFSQADLDTLEAGSFLHKPQIDGVTEKGEPFHLIAEKIAPQADNPNLVVVSTLSGTFIFEDGTRIQLDAESALLDIKAQTVYLEQGGQIQTSDGNDANVESLLANLSTGEMTGSGIIADGPLGRISATRFRIDTDESENRVLWFENDVKMIYDLQNEG